MDALDGIDPAGGPQGMRERHIYRGDPGGVSLLLGHLDEYWAKVADWDKAV